jgi:hypothetical protein
LPPAIIILKDSLRSATPRGEAGIFKERRFGIVS